MIRKTSITLFCIFLSLTMFAQLNDTDAFFSGNYSQQYIFKNRIKQISVETYINAQKSSFSIYDFDSKGLLSKLSIYDSSRKILNESKFTYNRQGHQIERKDISHEMNKTYVTSFYKKYKGSKLISESSDEVPIVTTYIYNKKGRKINSIAYLSADSSLSAKRVSLYIYNNKGKLTSIEETYQENKNSVPVRMGITNFIYNEAGNITNVMREGKANYVFTYNEDGLIKTKTTKMPEDFSDIETLHNYHYTFWN